MNWNYYNPIKVKRLFLPIKVYHIQDRKLTEELNQIIKDYANELEEL